jgi:hypothetical protein
MSGGDGRGWTINFFINDSFTNHQQEVGSGTNSSPIYNFMTSDALRNSNGNFTKLNFRIERWFDKNGSKGGCHVLGVPTCNIDAHTGDYEDWADCCYDNWPNQEFDFLFNNGNVVSPSSIIQRSATHENFSINLTYSWQPPAFNNITNNAGNGTICPGTTIIYSLDQGSFFSTIPSSALKYRWQIQYYNGNSTSSNDKVSSSEKETNTPSLPLTIPNVNNTQTVLVTCYPVINNVVSYVGSKQISNQISASPPTLSLNNIATPTCFNGKDGQISIYVNGAINDYRLSLRKKNGSGNYNDLSFSSNSSFPIIRNGFYTLKLSDMYDQNGGLSAGIYSIQVRNNFSNNGNQCLNSLDNIEIQNKSDISFTSTSPQQSISCYNGNNGTIGISNPIGGNGGPFSISINGGINGQLSSGTYIVRAVDKSGCVSTGNQSVQVTSPSVLIAKISTNSTNGYNISCKGGNDGQLNINFTGGTPPYSSTLLDGNGNVLETKNSYGTTQFSRLSAKSYSIITKDNLGCGFTQSTIPILTEPSIFTNAGYSFSNYNGYNTSCYNTNDAFVNITFSGGIGSKEATVYYGIGNQVTSVLGISTNPQLFIPSNTSNIIFKDANQCSFPLNNLNLTSPPPILLTSTITNVTCFGNNDGKINLAATGGIGSFKYSINDYDLVNGSLPISTISSFENKSSGNYRVRARDAVGCEYNTNGTLLTVTQPGLLTVTGKNFNVPCKGGFLSSISGMVSGGSPPYTFMWTKGYTNSFTGQSFVPNAISGIYSAIITDKNNCKNDETIGLPMVLKVNEPETKLSFSSSSHPVDCYGNSTGSVVLKAEGGWNTNYKFGISKNNISSILLSTKTISGLASGLKKYFIIDAEGCLDSTISTVSQPNPLLVSISTLTNISCFQSKNGVAILDAMGGNSTYTYILTPASLTAQNFSISTLTGLDAISYTASVTDEQNCSANTVTFTLTQPSKLIAESNSTDASCGLPTGTAVVTASGGVFPYTYKWSRNGSVTGFVTASIRGIVSGFYTAYAIDANQCITPTNILVNDLSGPTVTGTALQGTICWYDRTGIASASAIAFGNKSISGISWMGTGFTDPIIHGLKGDTIYYVASTDNDGCFSSYGVYVPGPALGQFSFTKSDPICHDGQTGKLFVTNVGGSPPYTNYLFTNRSRGVNADSLLSELQTSNSQNYDHLIGFSNGRNYRNYSVAFTDSKGCHSDTIFTTLFNPASFSVRFPTDSAEVCLGTKVNLDAGNPGKSYRWNSTDPTFSASTQHVTLTQPANYTVVVSDAKSCKAKASFLLKTTNGYPGAKFLVAPEVFVGDTLLLAEISWPYPDTVNWTWPKGIVVIDSSLGNVSIMATQSGNYSITMRAQQGICKAIQTKTIKAIPNPGRKMESIYLGLTEFRVFPNPSEGLLTVTAAFGSLENIQIDVLDALHLYSIASFNGEGTSGFEKTFDLSGFPSGLYFVRIQAGDTRQVLRWVKY